MMTTFCSRCFNVGSGFVLDMISSLFCKGFRYTSTTVVPFPHKHRLPRKTIEINNRKNDLQDRRGVHLFAAVVDIFEGQGWDNEDGASGEDVEDGEYGFGCLFILLYVRCNGMEI